MRITPPQHFRHAAELSPRFASIDPRSESGGRETIIDLRSCIFLRPPALLWCAIYPLLSSLAGSKVELLVPEHMGVCVYLKSVGLFRVLTENGIAVDDRGIRDQRGPQIVLPLTHFSDELGVERIANEAVDALSESGLGASNLYPLVGEVFAELALMERCLSRGFSHRRIWLIQFYEFEEGKRFVCGVADGGMGIRRSLEKNPDLRDRVHYDWDAIELAIRERISGTGDKTRGIGLYGVAEDMRGPRRQLIIHSGQGSLQISEEVESEARRSTLFPGTLAYASLPT